MKILKVFFISQILATSAFCAPFVSLENSVNFSSDNERLQSDQIKTAGKVYLDVSDYHASQYSKLQASSHCQNNKNCGTLVFRAATLIKGKSPKHFDLKKFSHPKNVESLFNNTTAWRTKSSNDFELMIEKRIKKFGFTVAKVNTKVQLFEESDYEETYQAQTLNSEYLASLMEVEQSSGETKRPSRIIHAVFKESKVLLKGMDLYYLFYDVNNGQDTLLVTYKLMGLKKEGVPKSMVNLKEALINEKNDSKNDILYTVGQFKKMN